MEITHGAISIVLPFTLAEEHSPALKWRNVDDGVSILRFKAAMLSLSHFFLESDVESIVVICPSRQMRSLRNIVQGCSNYNSVVLLAEDDLISGSEIPRETPGWIRQQLLKLAIAPLIRSEYYLTMDGDVICTRACSRSSLVPNGRGLMNVEQLSDYINLYELQFAMQEFRRKRQRLWQASKVLRSSCPVHVSEGFIGETPVLLCTEAVRSLLCFIENMYATDWYKPLLAIKGWTEYALYWDFLHQQREWLGRHELASADTVLSLSRSAWHCSPFYRTPRSYMPHELLAEPHEGYFVAIQSWLDPACWLPQTTDVVSFYSDLMQAIT